MKMTNSIAKYLFICIVTAISLLFSCGNKQQNAPLIYQDYGDRDSIPYEMWFVTRLFIIKEQIPEIEEIDEVHRELKVKTQRMRDSIIHSYKSGEFYKSMELQHDSLYEKVYKIINEKDINAYFSNFNLYLHPGLGIYVAEEIGFVPAYENVYANLLIRRSHFYMKKDSSLIEKKERNKEITDIDLIYLPEEERNSALYSLVSSYKEGAIHNADILAAYFKEGFYFPKNEKAAKKIEKDVISLLREDE